LLIFYANSFICQPLGASDSNTLNAGRAPSTPSNRSLRHGVREAAAAAWSGSLPAHVPTVDTLHPSTIILRNRNPGQRSPGKICAGPVSRPLFDSWKTRQIALVTYKRLSTNQPANLRNLLHPCRPSRGRRSASQYLLCIFLSVLLISADVASVFPHLRFETITRCYQGVQRVGYL